MGTQERKAREKERRKREILEAANHVFMLKGFNSATIEDIANQVELSVGTIYIYFKNKEELLASLMLIPIEFLIQGTKEVYDNNSLSPEEKINGFKEVMYRTFKSYPMVLRNIFHVQVEDTLSNLGPELFVDIIDRSRSLMEIYTATYNAGVSEGKFVEGYAQASADIMWATFSGLVMWEEAKRKLNVEKDYLKPTLDRAFKIYLKGIMRE